MSAAREQLAALLRELAPHLETAAFFGLDARWTPEQVADWLVARGVTVGVSSLRAPQSGPWQVVHYSNAVGVSDKKHYVEFRGFGNLPYEERELTEAEARAVCDALNAVAGSGAETPPQPEIQK